MINIDYNSAILFLQIFCGLTFLIQLYYFLVPYSRLFKSNKIQNNLPENTNCPPLSVIIVTKDSASMLKENLPAILEQDYPEFEVIVVNDESAGEDEDILKILGSRYHHLYRTFIPKSARYVSRKKLGVAMGIKASKYDWIVVTEPYCKPESKDWLRSLSRNFVPGTDIVLGYCNYSYSKGIFAKRIIADMLLVSMRFLGKALGGKPYMGIGRNMAYRKDIYVKHKGFYNQLTLSRGDDDLFINEIADKGNTKVCVDSNSIVRMPLPKYRKTWKDDKIGYEVTGNHYKGMSRISNGLETWSASLFNISVITALCISILNKEWIFTSCIFVAWLIRTITAMTVFCRTAKAMGEKVSAYFFIYDFMRPLYSFSLKIGYITRHKSDYMRK
ncbi:glycosyltransferase [uncultured Bacteroides sp.]|uniref:glycosyltransferase n=1 Tax=uncultured Bacteroides sp. TaxID=162156 RepID=UPI0026362360|nr:glycosyltransferase [uncultured Bacteroides sp.]